MKNLAGSVEREILKGHISMYFPKEHKQNYPFSIYFNYSLRRLDNSSGI